jgi:hypothetical protein
MEDVEGRRRSDMRIKKLKGLFFLIFPLFSI